MWFVWPGSFCYNDGYIGFDCLNYTFEGIFRYKIRVCIDNMTIVSKFRLAFNWKGDARALDYTLCNAWPSFKTVGVGCMRKDVNSFVNKNVKNGQNVKEIIWGLQSKFCLGKQFLTIRIFPTSIIINCDGSKSWIWKIGSFSGKSPFYANF